MLHSVVDDEAFYPEAMLRHPVGRLDWTLRWLKANGAEFISLDDAIVRLSEPRPGFFAAFTFDDGYADNLTHALPVMERHNAPFTVFVTTGMVTGEIDAWWFGLSQLIRTRDHIEVAGKRLDCADRAAKERAFLAVESMIHGNYATLPALKRLIGDSRIDCNALALQEGLTRDKLRELARHPLVTIGGHTTTHVNLAQASAPDVEREMRDNLAFLEETIQAPVMHFAYPFGNADACGLREARIAKTAGFRSAVTTRRGGIFSKHLDHLHELPREPLSRNDTSSSLRCKVDGFYRALHSRLGDPVARMEGNRAMAGTLHGRRLEEGPKNMRDHPPLTVSIVIKALNEEQHIAAAIESALAAVEGTDSEVILADCASTDRTVEIARQCPIKIVRMAKTEDRSCGAGAQLGFQYSRGRYIWLVDGDMRLKSGFLATAIQFLEEHPAIAGVGGMLSEHETSNLEYVKRNAQEYSLRRPGLVTRLDGGGVYRRSAIESVGYLTDRNLHGAEELELGARLVARGWKLVRLPLPDVDHYGHSGSAYWLLLRRLMTGVSSANGEVLRAALGAYHLPVILRKQKRMLILLAFIYAWWLCLLAAPALVGDLLKATPVIVLLALFPIVVMSLRSRSISLGLYSVVAWQIHALGFWPGFLRRRIPPTDWIASTIVENQADAAYPVARGELNSSAGQRATPPG